MKLALIRAKYNPFGGAERFLNDAVAALASSGLELTPTLFTREWPTQPETTLAHRIINPRYATSSGRDRGFAQAVCKALSADSFDLVSPMSAWLAAIFIMLSMAFTPNGYSNAAAFQVRLDPSGWR